MDRYRLTQVDRLQCGETRGQTESDTGRHITVWDFAGHVDRQRVTQVDCTVGCLRTRGRVETDTGRQITVWRDTWTDRE